MFVAIEGSDGAGKATQTELLAGAFNRIGLPCKTFAFPAYGETLGGRLLGELLSGKRGDFVHADPQLASLPYAIDRFEASGAIRQALNDRVAVIADRYIGANQMHQGGKVADVAARLAFLDWLDSLEYGLFCNPKPDLVVYLKVPLETSLELLRKKRAAKNQGLGDGALDQVERDRGYLANSINMANWLARRFSHWRVVDCANPDGSMRPPEAIHDEVWRSVVRLLG